MSAHRQKGFITQSTCGRNYLTRLADEKKFIRTGFWVMGELQSK
jgi:hypothetical protein